MPQLLEKSTQCIEHAKLVDPKKKAVLKDIAALTNEVTRLQAVKKRESFNKEESSESRDLFAESQQFPGASEGLKLETSTDVVRGRFVIAKDPIKEGDIVFRESPYSCVLLPPFYSTNCHHCLAKLQAPLACVTCTQTRYCRLDICKYLLN